MTWNRLRRLRDDRRGIAAVEMALIAPIAAVLALLSFQVWQASARVQDARGAVKAGVRYYMNGGADEDAARDLVQSSWEDAPADAAVTAVRACLCGGTAHACNTACADSTLPIVTVTLRATATNPGAAYASTIDEQEVIRVR